MLNRSSFLALAAITTLSVAALAPTSASAFGGHRGGGHISGGHGGGGHVSFGHGRTIVGGLSIRRPIRIVTPNHPPHWNWRWRHHGYYSVPVAVGATSAVYAAAPRAPAPSCTCLTKEYLPDGSLLFKDVCTNEAAMSAPAQQAEVPAPQAR
jgi:hypothetical protein